MADLIERLAALSPRQNEALRRQLAADRPRAYEAVAVIGMACRLPGGVDHPGDLWRALEDGVDAIGPVPADRWRADPGGPGFGGFLEDVAGFDPAFFGLSNREADRMDPQQRLLLEVAWEAVEAAGLRPSALRGTATGVFAGIASSDYAILSTSDVAGMDMHAGTGNAHSIAANRISYLLGLEGPSLALDTACSSSLVAVHLAGQSLGAGECDLALAGGVNLMLAPYLSQALGQARMLAPDGRCKTFDSRADGYVRSEGAGIVVLKRLVDALGDGDTVLAVIRGSAVNQDGRSNGLTAPNGRAQTAVVRAALEAAEIDPDAVSYIETHGTGTALGDPIEVAALRRALGDSGPAVHLGALKTHVGHLEAAAGIAGLIKTVLCLQRGRLPANLHLDAPNPRLPLEGARLRLLSEPVEWSGSRRVAGVSSFGFGGTNAHVLVQAAPPVRRPDREAKRPRHVLTISAHSPEALRAQATTWAAHLRARPDTPALDIGHTANARRDHRAHRVALVGQSTADWLDALDAAASGARAVAPVDGEPAVAFMFTGQGAQGPGMARALYEGSPVFAGVVDRACAFAASRLDWDLRGALLDDDPRIHQTGRAQPALFVYEAALCTLWRSWGVKPLAFLGHSLGEYVAAWAAGVFELEAALELVIRRGALMQALPGGGAMAAVTGDVERVRAVIDALGGVEIAAFNGPRSTTISGDADAVDAAVRALTAERLSATRLTVSHAFHSHRMAPILDAFAGAAASARPAEPRGLLISNLTGARAGAEVTRPDYWSRHIREPVRFAEGVRAMLAVGCTHVVEIGPRPALTPLGRACSGGRAVTWLPSSHPRRDPWKTLLGSVGALYEAGAEIDWAAFDAPYAPRRVALPPSAYVRRRTWIDAAPQAAAVTYELALESIAVEASDGTSPDVFVLPRGLHAAAACDAALQAWGASTTPTWLVTREAGPSAAAAAALWRCLALETPDRAAGHLDASAASAEAVDAALGRLPDAARQVVLDAGGLSTVRLRRSRLAGRPLLRPDGVYLITGGLGGAGRALAEWLVERGARHLVLAGRTGAQSEAARATVSALRARGATVDVAAVDVSDRDAVGRLVDAIAPLRGIIHAAGVTARAGADALRAAPELLRATMAPKVDGARHLLDATEGMPLDFFLALTSISGVWGSAELGAYAAANAALDAICRAAAATGRPAVSAALGPWSDGGMLSEEASGLLARMGLRPLGRAEALAALGALMARPAGRVVIADVDWGRFLPVFEARGRRALFDAVRPATSARPRTPLLAASGETASAAPNEPPTSAALLALDVPPARLRARALPLPASHPARDEAFPRLLLAHLSPAERRPHLIALLRAEVARVLELPGGSLPDPRRGFFDMGMDSLMAMQVTARLEDALGIELPSTALFDHPHIEAVCDTLVGAIEAPAPTRRAVEADDPIAIVGLGCRFPGGADDPEALWRLLCDGVDAVAPIPPSRWDADRWWSDTPAPGKTTSRYAALLDDVAGFDAAHFGISPREAARMDPQHRLLLEVAWRAIEDAGVADETQVGVFVGIGSADYLETRVGRQAPDHIDAHAGVGNAGAFAAGRLAYHLGLTGPALAVDTACSSSLVALHLAARALRDGECDVALAAGVNVILSPRVHVYLSRAGALAPDGRCKAFDARADGYGRGEGCGVVVLQRLSDARRLGCRVLALVAGTATNHDGRSSGLTVPMGPAQQRVIGDALARAGLAPADVDYVEAHGTGTALGDPIEAGTIDAVYGRGRAPDAPVRVGTVKTNLGHLEAAAGIAGIVKTALALHHGALPASLHFESPNPRLPTGAALRVQTTLEPWPRGSRPRAAGVSAFGLSGTNAHAVLVEAPDDPAPRAEMPAYALPVSAGDEARLARLRADLVARGRTDTGPHLADAALTLAGRAALAQRACAVGSRFDALAWVPPSPPLSLRVAVGSAPPPWVASLESGHPAFRARRAEGWAAALGALLVDAGVVEAGAADVLEIGADTPWTTVLRAAAGRFVAGAHIRWRLLSALDGARVVSMPQVAWRRERHWLDPEAASKPLPGERVPLPALRQSVYALTQTPSSPAWLGDHRLFGTVITPAAGHIAWMLAATGPAELRGLSFPTPVVLEQGASRPLQLVLDPDAGTARIVGVCDDPPVHAQAQVADVGPQPAAGPVIDLARTPGEAFYARFDAAGYTLGPSFRWIVDAGRGDGEAVCGLAPPPGTRGLGQAGPLHPGLLDSCFQAVTLCLPTEEVDAALDGAALFVPVSVEALSLYTVPRPDARLECHAKLVRSSRQAQVADLVIRDEDGACVARVRGLTVRRIPRGVLLGAVADDRARLRLRWGDVDGASVARAPVGWRVDGRDASSVSAIADVLGPSDPTAPAWRLWVATGPIDDLRAECAAIVDAARRDPSTPLCLLTRGAVAAGPERCVSPDGGALWGLRRALATEHPALEGLALDLDPRLPATAAPIGDLLAALAVGEEAAWRGGALLRARLGAADAPSASGPSQIALGRRADLESLARAPIPRAELEPGPDEVRVRVRATGINFRDVLGALGAYPGDPGPLGGECAGVVDAVGPGVFDLEVGDRVVAMIARTGCLRTHAVAARAVVTRLPDGVGFTDAVTAPVAYATAWHGLVELAALSKGERVLIHSAAGGVGLAALHVARLRGAAVVATAGSEAKRALLRAMGVGEVYDSRRLDYGDAMAPVDVVLNALGPEHVRVGLELLRPGGRFVEIGKADILDDARRAALGDRRYFHFDLVTLSERAPATIAALLERAMSGVADGSLPALPHRVFAPDAAAHAFRVMARAGHVGKLVIAWPDATLEASARADGLYLITGGRGALGLLAAEWLVSRGARRLMLAGRSAPDAATRARIAALSARGVEIETPALDVADAGAVDTALGGRSVAGILHAAGALRDGSTFDLTAEDWDGVFGGKLDGGRVVAALARRHRPDWVALYGSAAALFGTPGQAPYAAANAWLAGAAAQLDAEGVRARHLAWGPWAGDGMAAGAGGGRILWRALGLMPIDPADGALLLESALRGPDPDVAILPTIGGRLRRPPGRAVPPRFADAVAAAPAPAPAAERPQPDDAEALERFLAAELRVVLELGPAAAIDPDAPLVDLGVDSLMAAELAGRVEAGLGVELDPATLREAATLGALASHLAHSAAPPVEDLDDDVEVFEF